MKPIALLFLCPIMFFACVPISDSVTDYMNDSGCRPVNENCLGSPEKFFAQPQMRALETWRGRNVSELITEWGYPDKVDKQTGGQPGERYIYVEEYNVSGDMRYAYDYRFNDWDWTREPNRRYRCETYMLVSPEGKLTPLWVNRFGICTRFFNPRPEAPPRKTEQKS